MTLHERISIRHVNAYHHDNGLLLQFILTEFIEACEEIAKLEVICQQRLPTSFPIQLHPMESEILQQQIEASLALLTGSARNHMGLLSGGSAEGSLGKLKIYSNLFNQNLENSEKYHLTILELTEKIWLGCLRAIAAWYEDAVDHTLFSSSIEKISADMRRLAKLIAKAISSFSCDENVIFFVIRYRTRLDHIYGPRFVRKLLTRLYPKGLKGAQQFLTAKYTERGFDHILPLLAKNFEEIESKAL